MAKDRPGHHRKDVSSSFCLRCVDHVSIEFLGGQSEGVTSYVVTKTTASSHDDDDAREEGDDEEKKVTRAPKKRKTTARPATPAAKLAAIRVTVPIAELVENTACTFQGNMPDPDNCQCNRSDLIESVLILLCWSFSLLHVCRRYDHACSLSREASIRWRQSLVQWLSESVLCQSTDQWAWNRSM